VRVRPMVARGRVRAGAVRATRPARRLPLDLAGRSQARERACVRERRKQSNRAAAIGHLDRLSRSDSPQQLARPLP
jgi:hypothetical protein